MGDNVMRHYANKSTKTAHYVHYDQGDILCIEVIIASIFFLIFR
jgi:hypothetical protein